MLPKMATWAPMDTSKTLSAQRLWLVLCLAISSTSSADARIISGRGYSGKYSNGKKGNEQERQEEICKAKDCLSVWYLKFLSMTERLIFLFKAFVTNHS